MGVRNFRPTSPSRRDMSVSDFKEVTSRKNAPQRQLVKAKNKKGGRNTYGRITIRFRGGGNKQRYRLIDFKRNKPGVPAKVAAVEYDPNRTARIALLHYLDGDKRYIVAPAGLKPGMTVLAAEDAEVQVGNRLPLKRIPAGTQVHAIELKPGKGAQMARAAGAGAQIMAREGGYTLLRLPSGELRRVLQDCWATVGQVGNVSHVNEQKGKAGKSRWLGGRPHNRGTTMNPVDHPLGGGEGRTAGGRHPVSPWGKPTRGAKTRQNKATDRYIVARRGKKKRG